MLQSAFFDKIFDKNCLFGTQYGHAKKIFCKTKKTVDFYPPNMVKPRQGGGKYEKISYNYG